jgi:hypothetical protein
MTNECPRRTGLHSSTCISAKSSFYLSAFEISRSGRTASEGKNVGITTKRIQLIIEALFSKYTLQRMPEGGRKGLTPSCA